MIHSMAGGDIKNLRYADFAKVEILEGESVGSKFFYLSIDGVIEGMVVLVPVGVNNVPTKAKVLRVDKNVNSQVSPVPIKRAKSVIKIVKNC